MRRAAQKIYPLRGTRPAHEQETTDGYSDIRFTVSKEQSQNTGLIMVPLNNR